MGLDQDVQQPYLGEYVELFDLDATALGGSVYRFVEMTKQGEVIYWKGHAYTPVPVEAEGFEASGQGSLPSPKLRIANVTGALTALIITYEDLLGAKLTRWRTLGKYLDGAESADPNAHFPPDTYYLSRKSMHNRHYIEWELASLLDYSGQKLPRRQILRDVCTHKYRYYNGSGFTVYTDTPCPYAGSNYFDETGAATSMANDKCGKRLSDCKLRFPDGVLPTSAFPGVARTRVYS